MVIVYILVIILIVNIAFVVYVLINDYISLVNDEIDKLDDIDHDIDYDADYIINDCDSKVELDKDSNT
jgi:hypothetical protein